MNGKNYIKEVALLGVDRRKINIDQLPSAIKTIVIKQDDNEHVQDTELLLNLITYNSFYTQRGAKLSKVTGHEVQKTEETRPYTEKSVMDIFSEIVVQDYHLKNDLIKEWINKVDQRKEIITAGKALELIDIGINLDKKAKATITNIIGNRGRHILTFYLSDKYQVSQLSDEKWLQGSLDERKLYYLEKRKENTSSANKLLFANWKTDGQREQLAFLKIMSVDLKAEDLSFLEAIYISEYEGELINKKSLLSSKILVCSMLTRLDYGPLISAIQSGINDYTELRKANGIINSLMAKKVTGINLPQKQDDFWNGEYLNRLMGFDTKNMNIKLFDYDPYYWMNSFISSLPFSFWSEILNRDLHDVVKYFLTDDTFKSRISGVDVPMFQDAMIFNAIATSDTKLADAIGSTMSNEEVHLLAPLMSQATFEKYITDNRLRTELSLLESRSTDNLWSVSFSKNMVSELFNMCKSGRFTPNVKFGRVMARYFHRDAFGHLASVSKAQEGTQWYHIWLTNVLEPIRQSILIRQRINTL